MILKYQKVTDQFTTHILHEPDYQVDDGLRITELCTIGRDLCTTTPIFLC